LNPQVSGIYQGLDKVTDASAARVVTNLSREKEFRFHLIIPSWFIGMVEAGGLIPFYKTAKS